jgi:hypothetical protein
MINDDDLEPREILEDSEELEGRFIVLNEAVCRIAYGVPTRPAIGYRPFRDMTFHRELIESQKDEEQGRYNLAFDQLVGSIANGLVRAIGVKNVKISDRLGDPAYTYPAPFTLPSSYVGIHEVHTNFTQSRDNSYRVNDHSFAEILISEGPYLKVFGMLLPPAEPSRETTGPNVHDNLGNSFDSGDLKLRGRPPKFDWFGVMREIAILASSSTGLPQTQATLERWVANYFSEQFGEEPSMSLIRAKVAPIYERLRRKSQ